jgi:hypothetical protein
VSAERQRIDVQQQTGGRTKENLPAMKELSPATLDGRAIALARHIARGDVDAANKTVPPLSLEEAGAQIISLARLCAQLLRRVPNGDALLNEWALDIAKRSS